MSEFIPHRWSPTHKISLPRKPDSFQIRKSARELINTPIEHEVHSSDSALIRRNALNRIFGPEMMKLFNFEENGSATELFEGLFNHVFDAGTNRQVSCDIDMGDKIVHISESAVPTHSRSSLITHSMEQIQKGKKVEFGMIDLENFRDADFDLGKVDKGIHSADVLVNKTARLIRQALKESWQEFGLKYDSNSYELGRYGGDEFVISFIGTYGDITQTIRNDFPEDPHDVTLNLKDVIMQRVKEKLANETGYYQEDKVIKKRAIQLKKMGDNGSIVEWMQIPEGGDEREVYLDFFQRGTLFNATEFSRIINKYAPTGTLDMDLYRKDYPKGLSTAAYPIGVGDSLNEKIKYIQANHPELVQAFELAKIYDAKDRKKTSKHETTIRQERLLKVVEESIFDRLLGDMIYSKSHFGEHIKKGEIDNIFIIDFKYLKELNTGMTYADADMQLKKLWGRIQDCFTTEDRKKIIISRYAGAFYIGVRAGEFLSNNGQHLSEIRTVDFFTDNPSQQYTVPIGHARKRIHSGEQKEYYKLIRKMEQESDRNFYFDLIGDIVETSYKQETGDSLLSRMVQTNVVSMGHREPSTSLSKEQLYALLLKGKRKVARIQKVKEHIAERTHLLLRTFLEKGKKPLLNIMKYVQHINDIEAQFMAYLEQSLHPPMQSST